MNLAYYLSGEVLRDLEKATGMKLTSTAAAGGIGSGGGGVDAEEIGEEVVGEWAQGTTNNATKMQPKMHYGREQIYSKPSLFLSGTLI